MNMKKKIIIISSVVLVLLLSGICAWQFWLKGMFAPQGEKNQSIYVETVKKIANGGSLGLENHFSGTVEPQKELKVTKDTTKKVSKLNVSEGQSVKKGDVLFTYDVDEIALALEQAKLELEGIENSITQLKSNVEELTKQKSDASSDQQLQFTLQIQSAELDIKNKEYEKTTKGNEIEKLEKSLTNADVLSEIDGVIKSVNQNPNDMEKPYISILSTGNYRIKAVVTEMNVNNISIGQQVIIRSRLDGTKTWKGTIDTIDKENPVSDNNNGSYMMMGGSGGGTTQQASKYNFYVKLETYEDLILGQHVYVEPDRGQTVVKEGLWIPSYYITEEDGSSYVWVAGSGDKLEKRKITVGEYDESTDLKQINEGLTETDKIAFPSDNLVEGTPTTTEIVISETEGSVAGSIGGSPDGAMDSAEGSFDGEISSTEGAVEGTVGGEMDSNIIAGAEKTEVEVVG